MFSAKIRNKSLFSSENCQLFIQQQPRFYDYINVVSSVKHASKHFVDLYLYFYVRSVAKYASDKKKNSERRFSDDGAYVFIL